MKSISLLSVYCSNPMRRTGNSWRTQKLAVDHAIGNKGLQTGLGVPYQIFHTVQNTFSASTGTWQFNHKNIPNPVWLIIIYSAELTRKMKPSPIRLNIPRSRKNRRQSATMKWPILFVRTFAGTRSMRSMLQKKDEKAFPLPIHFPSFHPASLRSNFEKRF